jgi:hypothetical protein
VSKCTITRVRRYGGRAGYAYRVAWRWYYTVRSEGQPPAYTERLGEARGIAHARGDHSPTLAWKRQAEEYDGSEG